MKQLKAKKNSLPPNLYFQPSLMAVSSAGAEPTSCSTADISLPEAPHHVHTPDSSTRKPHVCLQPCRASVSCCRGTSYPHGRQKAPSCTSGHLPAPQHLGHGVRNSGCCSSLWDSPQPCMVALSWLREVTFCFGLLSGSSDV